MSGYKDLSEKLLENKELTYEDYFKLLNDKNFYETHYDEYFRKYLDLDGTNTFLIGFLVVSVPLNVALLIVMLVG